MVRRSGRAERSPRLTRERILDVARAHFGQRGYRKASLVDIARDLGVVKGALYYHVPGGKIAMFNAVMEREEERLLAAMGEAARRADHPRDALRAVVAARLSVLRELKDLLGVRREISEEISALTLAQERTYRRRERDLIESIMIEGESRGVFDSHRPRRAAAAAIQAMIHALTVPELYRDEEPRSLEREVAEGEEHDGGLADGPEDELPDASLDHEESAEGGRRASSSLSATFLELIFRGLDARSR